MKKLVNRYSPKNVLIVDDAYINGRMIVCDAGTDMFDLWEDCWRIEDETEEEE